MPVAYDFKKITVVPTASELKDVVLSKTQRKTPTVIRRHFAISRIRAFYSRKVKFLQQVLHDKLTQILDEFPKLEEIHPFYCDLMNILYDKDHYKIALGQMNTARHLIDGIAREYVRLMKYGDSLYRCKMLKRAALGRMVKLIKRQKSSFEYLEQVRQHLSRLPTIDPNTRTLILCGFPNVGKSSLMNKLTRADVDVQPYAFTTKALYVGHFDYKYLRWQVIDTPGILDQPLSERNTIEMQAITALAHIRAAAVFIMDISETCDHTIEEQITLFQSIQPLFTNKPIFVGLNKIDLIQRSNLSDEKINLIKKLEDESIPVLDISAVSQSGIMELRNKACDTLLTQRVENKLRNKKLDIEGSVLNRVFVAYPTPRDDNVREAYIPNSVLLKRAKSKFSANKEKSEHIRKLERDIELQMEDEYILDLKKHYLLKNKDQKYDIIPEVYEGHNIADFITPDLQSKFDEIMKEEKLREKAGYYDEDIESYDDETKEELEQAEIIQEKEKFLRMESQGKKRVEKSRLGRRIAGKRQRTASRLEEDFQSLGLEVEAKKMKMLNEEQERRHSVKKIRVGRTSSLTPKRAKSRDVQGVPNPIAREKVKKLLRKGQKPLQKEARKGEADRRVFTKLPKHLFTGKRGIGKTDRR